MSDSYDDILDAIDDFENLEDELENLKDELEDIKDDLEDLEENLENDNDEKIDDCEIFNAGIRDGEMDAEYGDLKYLSRGFSIDTADLDDEQLTIYDSGYEEGWMNQKVLKGEDPYTW